MFPNVTPDTYTVEVTLQAFKTVKRGGIIVSGGDRVGVPAMTIEPGAIGETVTVTGESPLVQTQSGERSFAVSATQIDNLPVARNNFTALTAFTPGVVADGASAGGTRLGGAGQNNIMMDGISAMDTGNNGQMLNMNVDAIGEVKILTQGYQAEYGRSSGLQITAVTKSGTNQFRGLRLRHPDQLGLGREQLGQREERRSEAEDRAPRRSATRSAVRSGKPGGNNKLFFFYSHEYRPVTAAINGGNPIRIRVPTALERAGDFSQTRDNTGALFNLITIRSRPSPCTRGQHRGLLPGRRRARQDSGEPPLSDRAWRCSADTRCPNVAQGAGPELQLRGAGADDRQPDAAAGDSRRLPAVAEAARHGQVLRPARAQTDHAWHDPGIQRHAESRTRSSRTTA